MEIQKITCTGLNKQLEEIQLYVEKIDSIVYDMGYGISDLQYHDYTTKQAESAHFVRKELEENIKNIKYILEQAIYKNVDNTKNK